MKNLRLAKSRILRRQRTSAAERQGWVQAWERSEQTQHAFAQAHGLRLGTLRNWVRRRDERGAPDPGRVELQEIPLERFLGRAMPEAATPCWELEVRLPSGITIAVAAGASTARLRELLEAVRC